MIAMWNLTNGRFPTDILIDFERGATNSLLIQALRDAFYTFALTYGSTVKTLDYKLNMSRNQSFPFNSECWLP